MPAPARTTSARVTLDRDAVVLERHADRMCLEGRVRLRPGHSVVLLEGDGPFSTGPLQYAVVITWAIARLTDEGPIYRGVCLLDTPWGTRYPPTPAGRASAPA